MTNSKLLLKQIEGGVYNRQFSELYGYGNGIGSDNRQSSCEACERYSEAVISFQKRFGEEHSVALFSSPGRTEICGNHTDHQNGRVLAAAIDLDIIAVVTPTENVIRIESKGFEGITFQVKPTDFPIPVPEEKGKSISLIRGICAGFSQRGYNIGGFSAYITSNIPKGAGLSSSAAYEVLVCTIMKHLYNSSETSETSETPETPETSGTLDSITLAKISQYAETVFFGKPSGLMDQMACATGGLVAIDFLNPEKPVIEPISFDFENVGYSLCIVDCGSDHSDLTHEYVDIINEMGSIASFLGVEKLGEIDLDSRDFLSRISKTSALCQSDSKSICDRAIIRAAHFFGENKRVSALVNALKAGDIKSAKELITESGESSYKYLQNIYSADSPEIQPMALALLISETLLEGEGAWRVHGGGFGGTIQAFVPHGLVGIYKKTIENIFGEGSCKTAQIRRSGAHLLFL